MLLILNSEPWLPSKLPSQVLTALNRVVSSVAHLSPSHPAPPLHHNLIVIPSLYLKSFSSPWYTTSILSPLPSQSNPIPRLLSFSSLYSCPTPFPDLLPFPASSQTHLPPTLLPLSGLPPPLAPRAPVRARQDAGGHDLCSQQLRRCHWAAQGGKFSRIVPERRREGGRQAGRESGRRGKEEMEGKLVKKVEEKSGKKDGNWLRIERKRSKGKRKT